VPRTSTAHLRRQTNANRDRSFHDSHRALQPANQRRPVASKRPIEVPARDLPCQGLLLASGASLWQPEHSLQALRNPLRGKRNLWLALLCMCIAALFRAGKATTPGQATLDTQADPKIADTVLPATMPRTNPTSVSLSPACWRLAQHTAGTRLSLEARTSTTGDASKSGETRIFDNVGLSASCAAASRQAVLSSPGLRRHATSRLGRSDLRLIHRPSGYALSTESLPGRLVGALSSLTD
jgi:hypothetical protein